MRLMCKQCGQYFSTKYRRGVFEFCSMDCFLNYLRNPVTMNWEDFSKNGKSYFKSHWEEALFFFLKQHKLEVQYEPFVLRLDKLVYIPDFYVNGHFIEVKGVWHPKSWKKVNKFKKLLDLTVLDGWTLKLGGII